MTASHEPYFAGRISRQNLVKNCRLTVSAASTNVTLIILRVVDLHEERRFFTGLA
jgi:hypothetical protein